MKILKLYIIVILSLIGLAACTKEGPSISEVQDNPKGIGEIATENTDNYSISYQYADEVIVLSESTLKHLQAIEDESILIFDNNTPQASLPAVGAIVTCGITEKTPYGIGNRVLSVTENNGVYVISTEPATLDEIFEHLKFSYSCSITDMAGSGCYDEDGNYYEYSKSASTKAPNRDFLKFKLNFPEGRLAESIFVNGEFYIQPDLTINFDKDKKEHQLTIECHSGFNGSLGIKDDHLRKTFPIIKKAKIYDGPIVVGPVVLRPYVNLDLSLKCALEGSFSTSIQKDYGFIAGHVKDANGGRFILENKSEGLDTDMIKNLELDCKGSTALEFGVDFGLGIFLKNWLLKLNLAYPSTVPPISM